MCGPNRTPAFRIKVKKSLNLLQIIQKLSREKNLIFDSDFPPTVFRIDSSNVTEIQLNQTIKEAKILDYETVFITGFDDNSQIYLTLKLED